MLDDIVDKLLRKHSVTEHEVLEVLDGGPRFRFVEKGHRQGENVYVAMGRSATGRRLLVFFVYKPDRRILVVSARDMSKAERRLYEKG